MNTELPVLNLMLRGAVVFFCVLVLLRISGKRQLGQMSASEFVAILLISNAVQNSMNGGDNSLVGGLILAAVLIALSWLVSWLTYRSVFLSSVLEGTPTLLIHHSRLLRTNLVKEKLNDSDLKVLLRKQGIHDFSTVKTAILEADGTLSVTKINEPELKDGAEP